MKNKGLTLIELIAVLTILAVIGLIVIPQVFKQVEEHKNQLSQTQIIIIEEAARSWATDNVEQLPSTVGETCRVTVEELKNGGYIDKELKEIETKSSFSNTSYVQIECIVANETNYDYKYTYVAN